MSAARASTSQGAVISPAPIAPRRSRSTLRAALATALAALLAACHTVPPKTEPPGNVSHLPPGNATRDGPEANPPPNLDQVPDAVPQIEPLRVGGPNKPYEVAGHTYVPLTDDRPVAEKGLASWYGKRFHGHRTASGEAYNMYAMTAAHKTLPIPSYARVRNPANGHEVIVRVNDRGPFSPGRIIDLSYTAALKLGVLGGVQQVEISRITDDDIRTGAAFKHAPTYTAAGPTTMPVGDLDRPAIVAGGARPPLTSRGRAKALAEAQAASQASATLPPSSADVLATAADPSKASPSATHAVPPPGAVGAGATGATIDLGAAAAADSVAAATGTTTTVTTEILPAGTSPALLPAPSPASSAVGALALPPASYGTSGVDASPANAPTLVPAASSVPAPARAEPRDEHAHADTTAGIGFWIQLGAYKQRDGALEFQRRLVDEQPWLAPLLTVVIDHGLNKLQAGPYTSRDDARSAAEHIRAALQLVPTIVEKR